MEQLLNLAFIDVRILDVFDILIVAYLMYRIFIVLKGSIAFNIFIGVVLLYLVYWLVETLQMNLLSLLLGKFMGFGVLILIIIFQPEIRKFLIALGHSTLKGRNSVLNKWFNPSSNIDDYQKKKLCKILSNALKNMSKTKTGALIISDFGNDTEQYVQSGIKINAEISLQLLLNIFFKNSPLHDGAVIINRDKIIAASCILPVSNSSKIPAHLGLRHRAAVGITEIIPVTAFIVSEENGRISISQGGKIDHLINNAEFETTLHKYLFNA